MCGTIANQTKMTRIYRKFKFMYSVEHVKLNEAFQLWLFGAVSGKYNMRAVKLPPLYVAICSLSHTVVVVRVLYVLLYVKFYSCEFNKNVYIIILCVVHCTTYTHIYTIIFIAARYTDIYRTCMYNSNPATTKNCAAERAMNYI